MMRKSELRLKDVIDINRGKRLGYIDDVDIDVEQGKIKAIVIPANENIFVRFFSKRQDFVIQWEEISKIGEDVILVDKSSI